MTRSLMLSHHVGLSGVGGVEQQFSTFVRSAAKQSDISQSVVVNRGPVHRHHAGALKYADGGIYDETALAGVPLPKVFHAARRRWIYRRQKDKAIALLWSDLASRSVVINELGPAHCLYWEHGSAWFADDHRAKQEILGRLPAVLCNSFAAKRFLELDLGYQGVARVIHNGLRTDISGRDRLIPLNRPWRIGLAARLVPIKAAAVALRALAVLHARGIHVCLEIAGGGRLKNRLIALSETMGISESVTFRGVVADMPAFYDGIDILLHPAMREPFGLVAAEAMAAGCPVVCTSVDGLPEVVRHGETGFCVAPRGDMDRYTALGGELDDTLPRKVYDPTCDTIRKPLICEPADMADAIESLISEPGLYEAISHAARRHVAEHFQFDQHVEAVLSAVREYAQTGTLSSL